jgi:hypothetical protein
MEYVEVLKSELIDKMRRNPQYSQRAFALHLNLSPGELSEILSKKRPLSLKKGMKVVEKLGLSQGERERFMSSLSGIPLESNKLEALELSADMFSLLSDYVPFAILNLADCQGFRWENSWIAIKLGVHIYEVEIALDRLLRVGMIKVLNDELVVDHEYVMTSTDIPSKAIRNYHSNMLQKAMASLEEQAIDKRDITGIGLSLSYSQINSIKLDISNFLDQMVEKYSSGIKGRDMGNRVYQLETALFELTKEATNE